MIYKEIFQDKEYLGRLLAIGLPLVLQQLITYSVNLLDTMMIGSFGDASLAAVNLVNQFYLIFSVTIFGAITGGNVLNAQFWGRRDIKQIHRVMGIQILFGLMTGLFFLIISNLFPAQILHFYSDDGSVIQNGTVYLRIISAAFLLFPIGQVYSGALRCTGNTRIPMYISAITLGINAILNYILIFGKLGLPALGLIGAGIATVIARLIEMFLYLFITYRHRLPTAVKFRHIGGVDRSLVSLVLKNSGPVIINELIWSLGTNMYSSIYAGISTASIAAYSAISPVDNIAQALFMGVGDASAVIIGNLLGAGRLEKAKKYASYTLCLSLTAAILTGLLLFGLRNGILSLYSLSGEASVLAAELLTVVAFTLWLRTTNYTIIIGVLRPGGQAYFCLILEILVMWMIGIPLARVLAVNFGLPIYWVYFGTVTEEALKLVACFHRYHSNKWVVNLVVQTSE